MKQILVRADDLGYSRAVNYGIYESIHLGFINNVGVMTNMPSTEQGLNLLKNEDIDYGMHTDITNGRPVLSPNKVPSLVDENGYFKRSKIYRQNAKERKSDFTNLEEVVAEIDAQYQRFLELLGRKPDYFEGHAVVSDNFNKALEIIADKYDLPLLSFPSKDRTVRFRNTTFKASMESMFPNYNPRNEFKELIANETSNEIPMMICHPGYLDQDLLNTSSLTLPRTQEVDMAIDPKMKEYIKNNDIHLVRYSECK